jgi:hypothetical protein
MMMRQLISQKDLTSAHSEGIMELKKTIAFDLDGTLCSLSNSQYELAQPYVDRIRHVNGLRQQGHKIIIFTARGITSNRDLRSFTLEQLEKWGLEFDELIMSKPHFDLLIDDKALSEKEYFRDDL